MDRNHGSDSDAYPRAVDRSRVLDVKPLRRLVPVFPNVQDTSSISTPSPMPFVCVSPSGPFPPCVQPFYPHVFQSNSGFGDAIPSPVPLNAYRTPASGSGGHGSGSTDEDEFNDFQGQSDQNQYMNGVDMNATGAEGASSSGKGRKRIIKKAGDNEEEVSVVKSLLTIFKLDEFDTSKRATGDKETVSTILLVFDLIRKRLTQLEEARGVTPGVAKRPDLRAATLLMTKGVRTNNSKRIGHVPGIEVGDIYFFRMELCIVGLHAPSMAGIDYVFANLTTGEEPLAVSIVSSGGYDDVGEDSDVIIYSGQGGVQRKDGQLFDQKLERGNLALGKSQNHGNEVRVIRGIKDIFNPTGKIYIYDGLYKIQGSWAESKSGCNVFKYKLVRVPGQPESFSLWKSIQQWKNQTADRTGIILPDLTSGTESQRVALVNNVDDDKGPAHFTYIPNLKYSQAFTASNSFMGCRCLSGCQPGDTSCPCNQINNGFLPYSSIGLLLANKTVVHECGTSCSCPPSCRNRLSQACIKFRLEVFKTKDRGWGLRSWDPIRAGSFLCEYAGDIINPSPADDSGSENVDDYIFDANRCYEPIEPSHYFTAKAPYPLVISAKNNGNVARFMNHSCSPNMFWLPVLRESNNDVYLHIVFFAIRHIPPMQELTYDYGRISPEKGDKGKKYCLCGSAKCRGYFF